MNNAATLKAKLDAFFETATPEDISALLRRTNYDFYKNVRIPCEACLDIDFSITETSQVLTVEIPVAATLQNRRGTNRPIVYIGREYPTRRDSLNIAADHQDLALAA